MLSSPLIRPCIFSVAAIFVSIFFQGESRNEFESWSLALWSQISFASAMIVPWENIELEVIALTGECMLTLNVADSMNGRELWKMILDKVPSKTGLQLVVSHTSRLVLHESLQKQGLGGQRAQVWATYMPVNLHAAWRFAKGYSVEDAEFSLTGIAELAGVSDETPALLYNLPQSLRSLTFESGFNLRQVRLPESLRSLTFGRDFNQSLDNVAWPAGLQSLTFGLHFDQSLDYVAWPEGLQSLTFGQRFDQSLDNVTWPAGLQSLTFGLRFDQRLDNVTWPAGLQSLTFGESFNQSLDNVTWPAGLQSLTFRSSVSITAWTTWHGHQAFKCVTFGGYFRSEPRQCDMAIRPAKCLTFGWSCQSEPGQCDYGQEAFKDWLLVGTVSIRAWTMWHGQEACKVWLLVGASIKAWTM